MPLRRDPGGEVERVVFHAELVDDDSEPAGDEVTEPTGSGSTDADVPAVRGPAVPAVLALGAARRPVVAPWLRDPAARRAATRRATSGAAHTTLFHAARLPLYAARLAWHAPRGMARLVGLWGRWVADAEVRDVRREAIANKDPNVYLRLRRDSRDVQRVRWSITGAAVLVSVVAAVLIARAEPVARVAVVAVLVAVLGLAGSDRDHPVTDHAVLPVGVQKITFDLVASALCSIGLSRMTSAAYDKVGVHVVSWVAPITRDGKGWRADLDLPPGVTASDVIARRPRLAGALGRPLGAVWPEGEASTHPGRLIIWVGDQDMASAAQAPWPLVARGKIDLFDAFPFGTDPRGRNVDLRLVENNLMIGAMPGAGKTFCFRLALMAAALDVRAELHVYELKGSGDLSPLARVAHAYRSGSDDDTMAAALQGLRDLRVERDRRAEVISRLPMSVCPNSKVTTELASRRDLGLHPLVFAIDECQELFSHPQHGKEARELATKLVKLGRNVGIILAFATQRPDNDSAPTAMTDNIGCRFCLKVNSQVANDMVLGTSAYKHGIRATVFRLPEDAGIGYLVGAGGEPRVVRSYLVDGADAERIVARAVAQRVAAGRPLTGHAVGEVPPVDQTRPQLIEDLLLVTARATRPRLRYTDLLDLLRADPSIPPGRYQAMTGETLGHMLRDLGVTTVQANYRVHGRAVNGNGLIVAELRAVLGTRPATDHATNSSGSGDDAASE